MEKNELINFQDVEKRLIWLDGQRVLPDFAVAELYGVETKRINEAVKNNPDKFLPGYIIETTNVDMTRFAVEISTAKRNLNPGIYRKLLLRKGCICWQLYRKVPVRRRLR